jgi:hypothetical protein
MFQSILNAANFKDALQDTLVSELASKNVSSHEFLSFIKLKHRLGSLFFEKSSFLCNLFLISNKLSLAKLYLTRFVLFTIYFLFILSYFYIAVMVVS